MMCFVALTVVVFCILSPAMQGVDEKMLKRVLAKAIGPSTTKMLQVY